MRNLLIFLAFLCFNSSKAQTPFWLPTDGLVAWYPFNGNTNDESANGNNGTTYSTTLVQDRFGNTSSAYSFNGINSHIEIPDAPSLQMRKLTLTAWIKPNSNALMQLFTKSRITDAYYEAYFLNTNFELGYKHNSTCSGIVNDWNRHVWNKQPTLNNWQFVVTTYDGNIVKGYIDGKLVYTAQGYGLIDSCVGGDLRIGYCWNSYTYAFNGLIDDIAIYNRAIDECEIQQLYTRNATTISTQPQPQTVAVNSSVQFTVATQGTGLTYTWQENIGAGFVNLVNNTIYSGVNTNTLTINSVPQNFNNYLYRCIVSMDGSNCMDTSTNALLTVPLAVYDLAANADFNAWPTPMTDKLNIMTSAYFNGKMVYIINELGQVVMNTEITNTTTTLSIQHLPPGTYYLKAKGHNKTLRLVKM